LLGLATFGIAVVALPAMAGPFGFQMGMSVKQVQALVKLEPSPVPGTYLAKTAPKPYPTFEGYLLAFSPKTGLAKVVAVGNEVKVAGTGLGLRHSFDDMERTLSAKYGGSEVKDELDPRSIWSGPGDWMQALNREERVLSARWYGSEGPLPDGIQAIELQAKAVSSSAGRLLLTYEFSNFSDFRDALDKSL
jgi:hypothetical protein